MFVKMNTNLVYDSAIRFYKKELKSGNKNAKKQIKSLKAYYEKIKQQKDLENEITEIIEYYKQKEKTEKR